MFHRIRIVFQVRTKLTICLTVVFEFLFLKFAGLILVSGQVYEIVFSFFCMKSILCNVYGKQNRNVIVLSMVTEKNDV